MIFSVAPLVADFYDRPELLNILRVFSIAIIFGSFSVEGKIDYSLKNLVSLSHRGPDSHKKYRDNFFFGEFFRWLA